MVIDSSAMLPLHTSQSRFKVGTALLPRSEGFETPVSTGGGAAVIPASISAERKAAAWTFVTWFIGTNQTADWSAETGYLPIRESGHALLESKGFYKEHPEFEVAVKQMKFAREAPQLPQWGGVWKIIGGSMTLVVRDDLPALRTLKDAEKKVDAALNPKSLRRPSNSQRIARPNVARGNTISGARTEHGSREWTDEKSIFSKPLLDPERE